MEDKKSIWGNWWTPLRKWVYPAWLIYETSARFYNYSQSVHNYLDSNHENIASYIGEFGSQVLDITCTGGTFLACSAFLTIPASFILHKFFKEDNLTNTKLEEKLKKVF